VAKGAGELLSFSVACLEGSRVVLEPVRWIGQEDVLPGGFGERRGSVSELTPTSRGRYGSVESFEPRGYAPFPAPLERNVECIESAFSAGPWRLFWPAAPVAAPAPVGFAVVRAVRLKQFCELRIGTEKCP